MALREFVDSDGVAWRVWTTMPGAPHLVSLEMQGGWLTFDCGCSRLRLAPIPDGWETANAERLQLFCRVATSARTSDPYRQAIQAAEDASDLGDRGWPSMDDTPDGPAAQT